MRLLATLPLMDYRGTLTRNVFIRTKVLESIRDNPSFVETRVLSAAERPDIIAHQLYGDSNLFWTILMINDVIDPNDWIMDDATLEHYTNARWDDQDATAMTEGISPFKHENNPFGSTHGEVQATGYPVSYRELEARKNDSRRIIKVIRKEYMTAFIQDVESKIKQSN